MQNTQCCIIGIETNRWLLGTAVWNMRAGTERIRSTQLSHMLYITQTFIITRTVMYKLTMKSLINVFCPKTTWLTIPRIDRHIRVYVTLYRGNNNTNQSKVSYSILIFSCLLLRVWFSIAASVIYVHRNYWTGSRGIRRQTQLNTYLPRVISPFYPRQAEPGSTLVFWVIN